MSKEQGKRAGRRFKRLHERGVHDDIKYRGPISYQGFMILGWLCIVMAAVVIMMKLSFKVNPEMETKMGTLARVLAILPELTLPFLLISNFSRILNNVEGYKAQLLRNGLATAGIFLGFNLVFYHYIVGSLSKIVTESSQVMRLVMDMVALGTYYKFSAFNVFIDLFLCTLFMFFLNYRPKKLFQGRWIILFRLFSILPVAYEFASLLLKVACGYGKVEIPVWAFPLLTVKPPMTFVVFVLMALFLKSRELRYCRHGNTHEDYEAFLQTNRNSLHFSIFLTIMLIFAGVADFIIMYLMMVQQTGSYEALEKLINLGNYHLIAYEVGFGKSISLMFIAPIMLLYSYTRRPKNENINILIPVAGVALILVVLIQGSYQLLCVANISRINYQEVRKTILEYVEFFKAINNE